MSNGACVASTEPGRVVICDAGPLIHLDELDSLDLLSGYSSILIPETVWAEVAFHRPEALVNAPAEAERMPVEVSASKDFETLMRSLPLHRGEQEALSLMREHPEALLLTDDAAARLAGKLLGYRVHGTLGVLLRSIRRGERTREAVLTLLRQLPERSTLHLKRSLLDEVIAEVDR